MTFYLPFFPKGVPVAVRRYVQRNDTGASLVLSSGHVMSNRDKSALAVVLNGTTAGLG